MGKALLYMFYVQNMFLHFTLHRVVNFIVFLVLQAIQKNSIANAQSSMNTVSVFEHNRESFPLSVVNLIFKNIIKWSNYYYKDAFRWHLITMQGNLFYQLEFLGLIAFIYVLCLCHHNKQPILYVHFTFFSISRDILDFPLNFGNAS